MTDKINFPLIPEDVDLRDVPSLLLDRRRALISQTAIAARKDARIGWASFQLWCKAMDEVPAGSFPADEDRLAMEADVSPEVWAEIGKAVMRPWVRAKTRTGVERFYHPVLCEKAFALWITRLQRQHAGYSDSTVRHNRRRRIKGLDNKEIDHFLTWLGYKYPTTARWMADFMSAGHRGHLDRMSAGQVAHVRRTSGDYYAMSGGNLYKVVSKKEEEEPPIVPQTMSGGHPPDIDAPQLDLTAPPQPEPATPSSDQLYDRWLETFDPHPRYDRRASRLAWDAALRSGAATIDLLTVTRDLYLAQLEADNRGKVNKIAKQSPERFLRSTWQNYRIPAAAQLSRAADAATETLSVRQVWQPYTDAILQALTQPGDPPNQPETRLHAYFRKASHNPDPDGGTIVLADNAFFANLLADRYRTLLEAIVPTPLTIRTRTETA